MDVQISAIFFSHERTCECQEYTTPSLTLTKIGVAIHVKFILEDGSFRHVDCDLNIPTIPVCTKYDGNIEEVGKYLLRKRPVGWLEEKSKLEDMEAAEESKNWQVKMRMVNRDLVLPRQSLLFLDQNSLLGRKSHVYVLLKVLKYCTGSSAKSYRCKYLIHKQLHKSNPEQINLCNTIRELIQFPCLRGKFSSVHEDLMAEGISRVEVTKLGFHFLRDKECNKGLVNQVTSLEDLDEEEMLMRAIAMSLEEEQKEGEVAQEELGSINIKGSEEEVLACLPPPGEKEEEEMVKRGNCDVSEGEEMSRLD